jgi:phospholipid transport system substrate-binding protein
MQLAFRSVRVLVISGILLSAQTFAAAEDDAIAVIASLHSAILAEAGQELSLEPRVAALAPVIGETHDMETMARLTVRRFWRDWSDDQRQRFRQAFERLSITTYASRFSGVGPDTFEIVRGEVVDEGNAEVQALIHRPEGEPVEMNYDLREEGGSWRIVQVRADGVSELSLMRSSYYEIIESEGFDGLIENVESEIADFYDR